MSTRTIQELERNLICVAIVEAVTPRAREIAAERATGRRTQEFELADVGRLTIKGYATPKQSVVAVAFEISFDLILVDREGPEKSRTETTLSLEGSCSYDPSKHETSDVVVRSWNHRTKGAGSYWAEMSADPAFAAQMAGTRYV